MNGIFIPSGFVMGNVTSLSCIHTCVRKLISGLISFCSMDMDQLLFRWPFNSFKIFVCFSLKKALPVHSSHYNNSNYDFCVIFNSCKGQAVLCHHVISRVCCTDNVTHISSENNMETLKRETFNSPEMLLCCRLLHHFGSLFLKQISHQQLYGLSWHVHMYSS